MQEARGAKGSVEGHDAGLVEPPDVKPSAPTPPSVEVHEVMREAFLSSHSLMCFEVALTPGHGTNEFTILELGEGARNLLSHAPWGTCTGSNVLHFIHHDDADKFISFLQRRAGPALSVAKDELSKGQRAEDTIKESTARDVIAVRLRRYFLHRFTRSECPSERPSFHRPAANQQDADARSQDWRNGAGGSKAREDCAAEGVPGSFAFPEVLADDPLLEDDSSQVMTSDATSLSSQICGILGVGNTPAASLSYTPVLTLQQPLCRALLS